MADLSCSRDNTSSTSTMTSTTSTASATKTSRGRRSATGQTTTTTLLLLLLLVAALALPLIGLVLFPSSSNSLASQHLLLRSSTANNNGDDQTAHDHDGNGDDSADATGDHHQQQQPQHLLVQDSPVIYPNTTRTLSDEHDHRRLANGVKSVLVIRVLASDRAPTASQASLQQYIFSHTNSLANQMNRCSAGSLQLTPAPYGNGGVIDVPVSARSNDLAGLIQQSQLVAPQYIPQAGGNLYNAAQHVMFVLPPLGGYVAEAEIGGKYSWYNDDLATSISVIMHEVGHNFGLDHAGVTTGDEYGDYSANMGRSVSSQETPLMCFNAANNWKLGWYPNGRRDLSAVPPSPTRVTVAAFVNYPTNHPVLVKLGGNHFLQYNEASRHNVGTRANVNQVVIVRQEGNAFTTLVAGLSAGQTHQGSGFVVQVCSLNGGLADLAIGQSSANCNGGSVPSVPQPLPVPNQSSWFRPPTAPAPAPFFRFTPSPPTFTTFRASTTPPWTWRSAWASLDDWAQSWSWLGGKTTTTTAVPSDAAKAAAALRAGDRRQ